MKVAVLEAEMVGRDKACFEFVRRESAERNVHFRHEIEEMVG
jgi:hypothetical protein